MTPHFSVIANGSDITPLIADRLIRLQVTDEAGDESDTAVISLDDRESAIALPPSGATLSISIGMQETGLSSLGLYTVDEIELSGTPETLVIRAKAADMRDAMKAPRTRTWHDTTLGTIVESIATDNSLTPRVAVALASVSIAHEDQTEESDLHLLRRLAREHDAVSKPAGGHLLFVPKGEAKTAGGQVLPTVAVSRSDLTGWRMLAAKRGKFEKVEAVWRDKDAGSDKVVSAGTGVPVKRLRKTYASAGRAERAAAAELKKGKRGESTLELLMATGRADIFAEARLTVAGIRDGIDGAWSITRVDHTLTKGGWTTRIEAETPTGSEEKVR